MKNTSETKRKEKVPVMMTVRPYASMPSVICSAVEADPKPLGPAMPVASRRYPISPEKREREREDGKGLGLRAETR